MATVSFNAPGGGDPVTHLIRILSEGQPNSNDLAYALERQKTRNLQRTLAGVSTTGGSFVPYSPEYAKFRAQKGRSIQPNLSFTGRMQASVMVQVADDKTAAIGVFTNSEDATKARVHNEGTARIPRREWLNPNDEDLRQIAIDTVESMKARQR